MSLETEEFLIELKHLMKELADIYRARECDEITDDAVAIDFMESMRYFLTRVQKS